MNSKTAFFIVTAIATLAIGVGIASSMELANSNQAFADRPDLCGTVSGAERGPNSTQVVTNSGFHSLNACGLRVH